MRTDGVVLEQYPKPRGKMYEPRRSVNVKPRLESQIQMQGARRGWRGWRWRWRRTTHEVVDKESLEYNIIFGHVGEEVRWFSPAQPARVLRKATK
jgi:hypothetical protein